LRQLFLTLKTLIGSIRIRGLVKTVRLVWDEWRFDRKYRMETSGLVHVHDLDPVGDGRHLAEPYMPTAYSTFLEISATLDDELKNRTFIDFGSGKGRALLLAGISGFRKIVGVEFDKKLCRVAEENCARFIEQSGRDISIKVENKDVREFAIPDDAAVFYFYNPFTETVMNAVLKHIGESLRSSPRKHMLVYVNPVCHEVFAGSGFRLVAENDSCVGQKYNLYQLAGS